MLHDANGTHAAASAPGGSAITREMQAAEATVVAEICADALVIGDPDGDGLRVTGSLADLAQFASKVSMAVHGGALVPLDELVEVWGFADLAEVVAPSLSCRQVNALIALFDVDARNAWLRYHLLDCDDPDNHRPEGGSK